MTDPNEREVLEALFAKTHNLSKLAVADWDALGWQEADRFTAMLDAGAYENAALMLVPEGLVWTLMTDFGGLNRARLRRHDCSWMADATTPALALCKAIAKAGEA
jgi:hypothetical protein